MAVSKDKAGKWQVQVWYIDWQGLRKQKHKRGFATKREAQAWERDFISQEHGKTISMPALIEAFKKDMDAKQSLGNLKASTINTKLNNLQRYIEPYFKQADAATVKIADINTWIVVINKSNQRHERMSSGTIKVVKNLLGQIFDFGIKHYGLQTNPVKSADTPAPYTNDTRPKLCPLEDFKIFYGSLKHPRHRVIFNTLYWSGLRIGELLAITPADLDGNILTINKTKVASSNLVENAPDTTLPKNTPSIREIVLPQKIADQLRDYIASIDNLAPTDAIFDIDDSTVRSFMSYRCKKLNLPHYSPHTLRHSFASYSLEHTKNGALVASMLGHANANTTYKTYAHSVPGSAAAAAEQLNEIIEI